MGDQFDHLNLLTSICDEFIPQRIYTRILLDGTQEMGKQEMFFPNFAIVVGVYI